jgi:decaprenyl-phosphate phosphoribosyltransferase
LFAPKLFDFHALAQTCWAFFGFCLGASSVSVVNDIHDEEADRIHPVKKYRPLAVGIVNNKEALVFSGTLLFFVHNRNKLHIIPRIAYAIGSIFTLELCVFLSTKELCHY